MRCLMSVIAERRCLDETSMWRWVIVYSGWIIDQVLGGNWMSNLVILLIRIIENGYFHSQHQLSKSEYLTLSFTYKINTFIQGHVSTSDNVYFTAIYPLKHRWTSYFIHTIGRPSIQAGHQYLIFGSQLLCFILCTEHYHNFH